ncbi:fimbrial protein [Escherichia coli]|uniref:fimbrial protein n=1 Tax=Escherichia coli TaxID=562 RepID=UPI000BE56722|nr:fimbrial protein [Escherichia coli]EFG8315803.1 type 1 fimbrial protein [Escherichia coli]
MKNIILFSTIVGLLSFNANAAGPSSGKINFNGTVVDSPCNISGSSADQSIDLGLVSKSILNSGGTSVPKDINITLENCDTTTLGKAKITFSGNTDGADTLLASGTAQNVGIKINGYGKDVKFGSETDAIQIVDGSNTLHFTAWAVKSAGGNVSEGNFSAVSNFNISYE